jgi:methyltransferase (TIGR00027 family)
MRAGSPSRTAEYMALFRAVESCRPEDRRLFSDPFAAGFLSGGLRAAARAAQVPVLRQLVPRLIDRRAPGPRISAVVRTRLIDDAIAEGLEGGARQLVILGAGHDSRAYRLEAARGVRVYEVDHPTTQAAKRARVRRMLGKEPPRVTFVPIDFASQQLGPPLFAAGYDPKALTFVVWEGVTNYLDADAVDSTLRWIAGNAPSRSRLSFTYVDRALLDGSKTFPGSQRWVQSVEKAGEPFTFGLDPDALDRYLAERGLELLDDTTTAVALARYGRRDDEAPPAFYHVALAQIA